MSAADPLPVLYERRSCSSCLNARRWLDERGIRYQVRDMFREPLNEGELTQLALRAGGAARIFSWKSPSARPLKLAPEQADEARLIGLMAGEPRLIRRPIFVHAGGLIAGAGPKNLEAELSLPPGFS